MKFINFFQLFLLGCTPDFIAAALKNDAKSLRRVLKKQTAECTVVAVSGTRILEEVGPEEDDIICVLDPADSPDGQTSNIAVPFDMPDDEKKALLEGLNNGDWTSDETVYNNPDATIDLNGVHVPPGQAVRDAMKAKNKNGSRRLATVVTGNKPILAVRVTDGDGKVHPHSAAEMSVNIFGGVGDTVNLKSQMLDCSMGQLIIEPGDTYTQGVQGSGVIEVTIGKKLAVDDRYTVHNDVTTQVQAKLGFTLPGPYQQVMYIVEGCYVGCGYAAYAYINSWMSVYQGPYYYMVGVQMHEIGHNLGLAHSGGLDGQTYTDHTCLMGNPLYSDEIGKMCFNPAKNWQLTHRSDQGSGQVGSWYSGATEVFTPSAGTSWSKTMVGIADYQNNPSNHPVVIKIETGTTNDYFIGFNRATGVNSQNDEADNEVTIVRTGSNGLSYSQSYLEAHLVQGESHTIANFAGTGQGLKITATAINLASDLGYADVEVCLGNCAPPTLAPTNVPTTSSPTPSPSSGPTTAPVPPTSSPTSGPTSSPTSGPTAAPVPPTSSPTSGPTSSPSSGPSAAPVPPTSFPTSKPTASPSSGPTAAPVPPTSSPTSGPTSPPTSGPTSGPTSPPTSGPTSAPTSGPTFRPCSTYEKENGNDPCPTTRCQWDDAAGSCTTNNGGKVSCPGACVDPAAIPELDGACAAVGEGCGANGDCCSEMCSGGDPGRRVCLAE